SVTRGGEADGHAPDPGQLAGVLRQLLVEARPPEALVTAIVRFALELDEHFLLVDHEHELEADAARADPGDPGRDDRPAADEGDLAADRRQGGALDQRALARQVAQATLDLAGRGLQLRRQQ